MTVTFDNHEVTQRLRALGHIYQTTDSILAGEKLKVQVVSEDIDVPAWTDGTTININATTVQAPDFDDIVRMHGLNFHELAHVRYTPRKGTELVAWVIENGYMQAFNVLEDQRIETLMTHRYPSTAPWLSAAIMRWVIGNPEGLSGAYAFVRGRRYLPGALRARLRGVFLAPELLPEIDEVVDAYRRLVFPTDYAAAKDLVRRFHDVMSRLQQSMGSVDLPDIHHHHKNGGEVLDKGRPVSVTEQRRTRDQIKPDDTTPNGPSGSAENEGDSGNAEGPETEGSGSGEPGDDSTPGEFGSGDSESGTDSDTGEGSSSGGSDGESEPSSNGSSMGCSLGGSNDREDEIENIRDLVEDLMDEILDRDDVYNEVRRAQRQIRHFGGGKDLPKPGLTSDIPASPEYVSMFRRLQATLHRLRSQADPGWLKEESTGRFNPARWAVQGDVDTAFDRWNEGVHDALDIEVVLLIDYSGSMKGLTEQVSNAMWALKRALDATEVSCTVLAYDNDSYTLYTSNERVDSSVRVPFLGGGTDPVDALEQATRITTSSSRKHRVVITLTDGEWNCCRDVFGLTAEDYIQKMNQAGVLTATGMMIDVDLLDRWESTWLEENGFESFNEPEAKVKFAQKNAHGAQIAGPADGENLVGFVSSIVLNLIRSQMRGAA